MSASAKGKQARKLAAFERVVSEYEAPLLRYASRLLMNSDLAQDVVQNTFIRFFRRWKDVMEPSPQVSSWLYRVAHNCAVDILRSESRRKAMHEKHAEDRIDFHPPDRGRGFRISEAAARAAAALQTLSLRERELVVLKVYEEKSYKEIGEIMGLTVSNVGYILHHAMKKLAAELNRTKSS